MRITTSLAKFLCGAAVFGLAASAYCLTIVPTFDSSITGDPNAAAMEAAINAAITVFETNYTGTDVVQIDFISDSTVGLGESTTWTSDFSYSSYLTALKSTAADANDTNALSKLPNGTHDPVINGTQIHLTLALARHLGLASGYGPDGFDSTIRLNTTIMNFTRTSINPDDYDMEETCEHEIDEVLGTASHLPTTSDIAAVDLFRYTTNLTRTFITSGDNAYLSVDGTNLWARYNMVSGGDYGDFWSYTDYWAPPGKTAGPQVQDAFGTSGQYEDIGVNEMAILDVVGWTLAAKPVITIARSTAGHLKLSWPTNLLSQFSLQESTNLNSATNWIASVSGSTNPAIVVSSPARKFYRLVGQAPMGAVVTEQAATATPSTNLNFQPETHVYQPFIP
jgi:hypothetical protein